MSSGWEESEEHGDGKTGNRRGNGVGVLQNRQGSEIRLEPALVLP